MGLTSTKAWGRTAQEEGSPVLTYLAFPIWLSAGVGRVQGRLRALCVNADATGLMVRTVLLEKFGYEVIPATTGKQAIAIVASEDINLAIVEPPPRKHDRHRVN